LLAKRIIEVHGAEFWIKVEGKGNDTTISHTGSSNQGIT